jgi:hypothetical protein
MTVTTLPVPSLLVTPTGVEQKTSPTFGNRQLYHYIFCLQLTSQV